MQGLIKPYDPQKRISNFKSAEVAVDTGQSRHPKTLFQTLTREDVNSVVWEPDCLAGDAHSRYFRYELTTTYLKLKSL